MNTSLIKEIKPYPEDDCACDLGSQETVVTDQGFAYLLDSATGDLVAIPLA